MITKLILACLTAATIMTGELPLPTLQKYSFTAGDVSRILPGKTQEINFDGVSGERDRIGRIAVVAMKYHSSYWVDGRYNHNDFPVEKGTVELSGTEQKFDAYRISEAKHKASQFLGSQHGIFYLFPEKTDWNIYILEGYEPKLIARIPAAIVTAGEYTKIEAVSISKIKGNAIYFFAPARTPVSQYRQINSLVDGGLLATTPLGNLTVYRHNIDAKLPDPRRDPPSLLRRFFLTKEGNGPSVIWQDKENKSINITRFSTDLLNSTTTSLDSRRPGQLLAACIDPEGNIYYLLAHGKDDPEKLELVKTDLSGKIMARSLPDISKTGLNIYSMGSEAVELKWSNGKLCLILMRTMNRSDDGLNHQGAIAAIMDATDLRLIRNLGQTSGHSFDNYLIVNSSGDFIGMDLGDNYPRGIHLHRLSDSKKTSRLIYTFKTEHGRTPKSPAGAIFPEYPEISSPERTYYKWSNDNRTYTELGGILETANGYAVIFAGEPSPEGRVLDNSRTSASKTTDMRNIGFLLPVKHFDKIPTKGSVIPDELLLSKGLADTGGFYSFAGRWTEQRSTGVIWLTSYSATDGISARHIKTATMSDGNILILWETTQRGKHHANWAMSIRPTGEQVTAAFRLPEQIRFNRRDAIIADGKRIYIASGDSVEKRIELFVLNTEAR